MVSNFIEKNCEYIFKYPRQYILILITISLFLGYFYITLTNETSLESMVINNDPDLEFYKSFKKQFGDDEVLIVGFFAENVYSSNVLKFIESKTKELEELDTVKKVVSLSNVDDFIGSDYDFIIQPLLDSYNPDQPEKIRHRAEKNSLIINNLVNSSGNATLFLIRPETTENDPEFDDNFVTSVENLFQHNNSELKNATFHIAGWSATDVNMSRFMSRDMMVFMPLTYFLLIALISIVLRHPYIIAIAIINVTFCLIWSLAFLNLIGGSINPITSILPPLIMALAVSDSIHIFTDFLRRYKSINKTKTIIKKTVSDLAVPCFLTSFTTAIGFASLAISDIPPIRHFGIAAALGMIAEYILSMTIIPLGVSLLASRLITNKKSVKNVLSLPVLLDKFSQNLGKFKTFISIVSIFIIMASIYFSLQIKVETNLLKYFKESTPINQASHFIDNHLGGVETLEVSLSTPQPDQILEPENLALIEKIEKYLLQQTIVTEVTSIADYFREMNKAFHNEDRAYFKQPDTRAMAAQYLLLYDGDELDNLLDENRQWTRISARITEHNSANVDKYIKALKHFLKEETEGLEVRAQISGKTLIANKLINLIVNSQIQSLALAFILIFLVMLAIFKSIKLGLISIIPNLIPIFFNFAIMGAFGIPLNSATAVIAAVAIGIAVDDTIHFICEYQRLKKEGLSTQKTISETIITKGQPIILTSLIMSGGFGVLLFASFIPTIQFGLLSALIMLFAVISDLLILPAILLIFDYKPNFFGKVKP